MTTTVHERAELLIMLAGSKAKALEIVREEMNERRALRVEIARLKLASTEARKGYLRPPRDWENIHYCDAYDVAIEHIEDFLAKRPI